MSSVGYLCQLWCEAECQHHLPCEIPTGLGSAGQHPMKRGRPLHFAYDAATGQGHEWNGKAGKCIIAELPADQS